MKVRVESLAMKIRFVGWEGSGIVPVPMGGRLES